MPEPADSNNKKEEIALTNNKGPTKDFFYYPLDIDEHPEYNDIVVLTPLRYSRTIKYNEDKPIDFLAHSVEGTGAQFFLPMPQTIQFENQVQWENTELGLIGNLASILDVVEKGSREQLDTILDKMKNLFVSGADFKDKVIKGLPSLIGAISSTSKISTLRGFRRGIRNPFLEQLFNGVGFRGFSFTWKIAPRNEEESKELKEMIKWLRWYSYPNFSVSKSLLAFPHYWIIEFVHRKQNLVSQQVNTDFFDLREKEKENNAKKKLNDSLKSTKDNDVEGGTINFYDEHPFLPKIRRSTCSNVVVNYTADGEWFSHKDGMPVIVDLTMSFTEAEIITKEAIKDGF